MSYQQSPTTQAFSGVSMRRRMWEAKFKMIWEFGSEERTRAETYDSVADSW